MTAEDEVKCLRERVKRAEAEIERQREKRREILAVRHGDLQSRIEEMRRLAAYKLEVWKA